MRGADPEKAERSRLLRRASTEAEKRMWSLVRNRRVADAKFVRQAPIGPFIVDFACRERRLIIEVDGGQHADSPADEARDVFLRSRGFRILRFWNNEVLGNVEGVRSTIEAALGELAPHPAPLPAGAPRPGGRGGPAGGEREIAAAAARKTLFRYAYARSADQDRAVPAEHPVVVVGAGPVGLTAALDLASRGVPVVLLDDADRIGEGSRGICYAKRSLEIWDRLGIGGRIRDMGVTWRVGRVFRGERELFSFDLLPEAGHKMPAFVNLQQYYLEKALIDRVAEVPAIDLRWKNRVTGLAPRNDGATLTVETPDGPYRIDAQWVIAADGARSTLRDLLGLGFAGVTFEDKFLIADIRMQADLPSERHFWFDPPFHAGHHVLMHRQPDDIWRIDFQLGADADMVEEAKPERVMPRLKRMLGDRDCALEWASVYQFHCRRLDRFVHGRVIFAGDAAHQVAPFGARGGNSGVQDAENIAWKLAALLAGEGGPHLLDSYDAERVAAADENIAYSTAATEFIAPADPAERVLRDAVLALAPHAEFGRRMVNSGRLSTATVYRDSPLTTPDEDRFGGMARLGGPLPDAPMVCRDGAPGFLLENLRGAFTLLRTAGGPALPPLPPGMHLLTVGDDIGDPSGLVAARLDLEPGTTLLIRPDQHLCARWRQGDPERIVMALTRARGFDH